VGCLGESSSWQRTFLYFHSRASGLLPVQSETLGFIHRFEKSLPPRGDLWLWRDNAPVERYVSSEYVRQGLRIPDHFGFDSDNVGNQEVPDCPA
jgi:hypothetical protein